MVAKKPWVESRTQSILLFAATASVIFPSIMCQTCHYIPRKTEPIIEITSASEFCFCEPVNVTCTAQENKDYSHRYDSKPTFINWFYGKEFKKRCWAKSADTSLTCSLVIDSLTSKKLGNYTCQASTSNYHCSIKHFEIDIHGVPPAEKTTEAPTNQSIVPEPNVTINCTDYGKNQCASNKTSEDETVQGGVYHSSPVTTILRSPETHNFLNGRGSSERNMIAVVVPSVISALVVFGIGGFLWFRRGVQRRRDPGNPTPANADELPLIVIRAHEEFSSEDLTALVRLQEEFGTTNNSNHIETSAEPDEEPVTLPLITSVNADGHSLLTEIRVEIPDKNSLLGTKLCSRLNNSDNFYPERPPKPVKKGSTEKQMKCSCMTVPENQSTMQSNLSSKDSGYDSAESRESISEMPLENRNAWQIRWDELKVLDEVLGKGGFGIVKKGFYRGEEVAVKQCKAAFSRCDKDDLLNEIKMLKQAGRHPNIVSFIGACTQEDNILLITELVSGGSLESLLRSKPRNCGKNQYENVKCRMTERELLQVSLQVALGMQHLEEKKYIHRDLAARNVFIGANKIAKVGDFGLARDVSDGGIYTKTSNGGVPWRWSSLESLKFGVYTSKSDVWSFGILLWEIATYGKLPYPDIFAVEDLIEWLSCGNRMLCPLNCCKPRYELMSCCWDGNPLMRPTFACIVEQLEKFSRVEYKREYVNLKSDDFGNQVEV
ncbi:fibroblast growth factor receptor 2-like [Stylophora pistillata]|uniref:receptor protein-tyrosine kinase n=1 Tax=Stylophora pistillata TaxID=50429 RepID=A0A2B4SV80_STYPI|nr:fibroblast growth factor receptor 2-like [Stylophora pistillata]XP_022779323.1 fibroblast growth factor receptor 2-like [Stylophora pistillata]XP_022779324.1 fibroblast growth factor receptor 2-like [Stylophora pistillata]PFX32452.1 Fibroblast growth factor receptor 1 [Stylophora pistillata]